MRNNLCSFKFQCYSLLSIEKTFSCSFFHCFFFFIVVLENLAPFSLNFSSSMTYSSKERSSHIDPSPQPHPQTQIIPLKNVCTLPNNHYCMHTLAKVCNLQPLPQGLWGSKSFPKTQLLWFSTMRNKMAISKF